MPLYDFLSEPVKMPASLADQVMRQIIDVQAYNKERVQTPYLQLVMTSWWEHEVSSGSGSMQIKTLNEDLGGVKKIVDNYLEATINGLPEGEQEAAAAMFEFMVTSTGRKLALSVSELTDDVRWSGIDRSIVERVLKKLQQARIICSVPLRGQLDEGCYEFAHDVVAKAARDWRQKHTLVHRAEQAKQEAARARLEAEEAKVEAAKRYAEAKQAKFDNERARVEAEQAKRDTAKARADTERVFQDAEKAMKEAEEKILAAKQETERAELAVRRAEEAEKELSERKVDAEKAKQEAQEARNDAAIARREERKAKRLVNNGLVAIACIILLALLWKIVPAQPRMRVDPATLSFPDTPIGTAVGNVGVVALLNPGMVSTYIDGFFITPSETRDASSREFDFFSGSTTCKIPGPLNPASTCTIQVNFNPATPGIKSARLHIITNAGEKNVTLSGKALPHLAK
jgi:hypothetical protein